MYSQGQGVIQHLETAYMWLSLADLRGVNDASRNLEIVAQKMTQEEITEARRRTTKCLESGYKHCLWLEHFEVYREWEVLDQF